MCIYVYIHTCVYICIYIYIERERDVSIGCSGGGRLRAHPQLRQVRRLDLGEGVLISIIMVMTIIMGTMFAINICIGISICTGWASSRDMKFRFSRENILSIESCNRNLSFT